MGQHTIRITFDGLIPSFFYMRFYIILALFSIVFCIVITQVFQESYSIQSVGNTSYVTDQDGLQNWKKYYLVGKFIESNPPKPDQIFIFKYAAKNGSVENINGSQNKGVLSTHMYSIKNGTLEIMTPRNYPYTNVPVSEQLQHRFIPIILVNNHIIMSVVNKTTDCFFKYSVPFSGDSRIDIIFEDIWVSGSYNGYPYHGDSVPQSCNSPTIAGNIPPLEQINAGVDPKNVTCTTGLVTVLHPTTNMPACVRPDTASILIERGWTIFDRKSIHDSNQEMNGTLSGNVVRAGGPRSGSQVNYEVDVYATDGVTIVGKTLSDANGNYSIQLPAGNYTIYVPDYPIRQIHPVSVISGEILFLT